MAGTRVAVVTGSNQGIGLAIVKELCQKFNGVVYLTSRDEQRGKLVVEDLKKTNSNLKYHQLDIDDESSVVRLRDYLKNAYGGLDVLVNNAAILILRKEGDSQEVFEKNSRAILQTNFFNTHRACNILFPILKPQARVVNMSSSAGHLSQIKGDGEKAVALRAKLSSPNLSYEELHNIMHAFLDSVKKGDFTESGWPDIEYVAYIASKIGVSALTRLQQRDFDKDSRNDIIINHVHPGYVVTRMTGMQGELTVEQGAAAATWLAFLPPNSNIKGAYVWHDKQIVDWVQGPMPAQY